MINWPDKNKTADFNDLVRPVLGAIKFAYTLKRKNKGEDIPWDGLDLTLNSILAGCPHIATRMKADSLEYAEEEQGRDALNEVISAAIQLGIEQGVRIEKERTQIATNLLSSALNFLKDEE